MSAIILASGSPRRRELLEQIHLPFEVLSPDVDESADPMPPQALVQLLSQRKAAAVAQRRPEAIVIAADTVVALEDEVLGKPRDAADAARMLGQLSGREHSVYTGFTVRQGARSVTCAEQTVVTFRPLLPEEIERYVASGEPMGKAGAYGVQGLGRLFVERLDGDYYNVVGLPVCRLCQVLRQFGVTVL